MQTHLHTLLKIFGWTTKVLVFFFYIGQSIIYRRDANKGYWVEKHCYIRWKIYKYITLGWQGAS